MDPHDGKRRPPTEWLTAEEACQILGIKKPSLYAYASRGHVRSLPSESGRARRYARTDVERLVARKGARAGHSAVAAGALRWGEPVLDSGLTAIGEDGPVYRGHSAVDLVNQDARFEAVAELLWTGQWHPNVMWASPEIGLRTASLAALLPSNHGPLDALSAAVSILATRPASRDSEIIQGQQLIRRMVAMLGLTRGMVDTALKTKTVARSLLIALGAKTGPKRERAVNRALVLLADHELNPSSFAARIPASVGAGMHASVQAALATLSGREHGAMTERVEALIEAIGPPERAVTVIRQRLQNREAIPGFGHRLYPGGDPRTLPLVEAAMALSPRSRIVRTCTAVKEAMALANDEAPTVDLGLVALAGALGLPRGGALALFAIGRTAGWVAHAMEQRAAGYALRPRARYVGPAQEG